MADSRPDLRAEFHEAFTAPFTSHDWASGRGRSHWVGLEGWQDSLAGPLSAVAATGGCAYAYLRDDGYFAGVSDPASLRSRLLEWYCGLAEGVEQFVPATAAEAAGRDFMRSLVGRVRELVERACAAEQARWQVAKQAEQGAAADGGGI